MPVLEKGMFAPETPIQSFTIVTPWLKARVNKHLTLNDESQSISKQFDLRSLKVVYLFEEEKRENTRDQSFDHSSFSSCYLIIFFCALSRRNNNLSQEVEKNRVKKCQLSFKLFPLSFLPFVS